jgi:hypothetical protein
MITTEQVHEAVPVKGAERALQVFSIMRKPGANIEAMARAILAYFEWQAEQSHETRMLCALSANKIVTDIRDARAKYRTRGNGAAVTAEATRELVTDR